MGCMRYSHGERQLNFQVSPSFITTYLIEWSENLVFVCVRVRVRVLVRVRVRAHTELLM